jgi:hypothetical protein
MTIPAGLVGIVVQQTALIDGGYGMAASMGTYLSEDWPAESSAGVQVLFYCRRAAANMSAGSWEQKSPWGGAPAVLGYPRQAANNQCRWNAQDHADVSKTFVNWDFASTWSICEGRNHRSAGAGPTADGAARMERSGSILPRSPCSGNATTAGP